MYEVAPVEVVQLKDTEALPAVAASPVGAEGTLLAPEELELLLDELDEDELEEELLELEELEEEDEELEDEELDELLLGVAEVSVDCAPVPVLLTAATL